MCLGLVSVLGGKGMQVSKISQHFPQLCSLLTRWTGMWW